MRILLTEPNVSAILQIILNSMNFLDFGQGDDEDIQGLNGMNILSNSVARRGPIYQIGIGQKFYVIKKFCIMKLDLLDS